MTFQEIQQRLDAEFGGKPACFEIAVWSSCHGFKKDQLRFKLWASGSYDSAMDWFSTAMNELEAMNDDGMIDAAGTVCLEGPNTTGG